MFGKNLIRPQNIFQKRFFSSIKNSFQWNTGFIKKPHVKSIPVYSNDIIAILLRKGILIDNQSERYIGPSDAERLLMLLSPPKPADQVLHIPLSFCDGYGGPDNTHYTRQSRPFIETALQMRFPEIARFAREFELLCTSLRETFKTGKDIEQNLQQLLDLEEKDLTFAWKIPYHALAPEKMKEALHKKTENTFGKTVILEPFTLQEITEIRKKAHNIPVNQKAILWDGSQPAPNQHAENDNVTSSFSVGGLML